MRRDDSMAHDAGQSSEADVSGCVARLIHAFTDGLNIFRRVRERRRKKKAKKNREKADKEDGGEVQLSKSLRRGPKELQARYAKCYGQKGESFAKGDSIAHASLAETLIKLNTGLVSIIAAFLNQDPKNRHLNLDYKSLTSLSEASRRDAMESMHQLCMRLNQSQLQVNRMSTSSGKGDAAADGAKEKERRARARSSSRSTRPMVARMQVNSSLQTQLVMMRPRPGRKGSASSATSTRAASTTRNSSVVSPLPSPPLPQYAARDPFPFPPTKPVGGKSTAKSGRGRARAQSFDGPRPTTWPHGRQEETVPVVLELEPPKPHMAAPTAHRKTAPPRKKHTSPPLSPSALPMKRRMDKATPSTYTFASDSTKLGEIPQRNWTEPWNYEEAERLNAEAAEAGLPTMVAGEGRGRKKGLLRFLRRGSAQAA